MLHNNGIFYETKYPISDSRYSGKFSWMSILGHVEYNKIKLISLQVAPCNNMYHVAYFSFSINAEKRKYSFSWNWKFLQVRSVLINCFIASLYIVLFLFVYLKEVWELTHSFISFSIPSSIFILLNLRPHIVWMF